MTVEEYYKLIDPAYGSQEHQRQFIRRMELLQELEPCARDHSGDKPPTHLDACYSGATVELVRRRLQVSR